MTTLRVGGTPGWATRFLLALTTAFGLCAASAFAQHEPLTINDKQYLERRGLNVLVFTNEYSGMFFDEKTAGIEIIHHGVRTATGGAVRLSPTPEQWDQIPKVVDRKVLESIAHAHTAREYTSAPIKAASRVGLWSFPSGGTSVNSSRSTATARSTPATRSMWTTGCC